MADHNASKSDTYTICFVDGAKMDCKTYPRVDPKVRDKIMPSAADQYRPLPEQKPAPASVQTENRWQRPSDLVASTRLGEVYEMGGKRFTVAPDVKAAFKKIESETGIPYLGAVAVCGRESDCQPERVNPSSGACGLFQLMTNQVGTLYEAMYKFGKQEGYPEAAKLVERFVRRRDADGDPILGYRPVSERARERAKEMCLDPEFNARMWAAYKAPNVERYNEWLGNREITTGEFVAMNNLGLGGLQAFAKQAWQDKKTGDDTLAIDFFKRNRALFGGDVSANSTLIYNESGGYKTVRESYADIFTFGGYGELKMADAAPPSNSFKPR